MVRLPALIIAAAGLAGCSPEHASTNDLPAGEVWEVGVDPVVAMGVNGADANESLYRTQAAALFSDGRVAVADGGLGRSRVSVFSADGRYLRPLGATGDGPGEFRWITSLQVGPGDSLFVFDSQWQRLTVFSPDGALARTARFQIPLKVVGSDGLSGVWRLADGAWVGRGMESVEDAAPGQIVRDTIAIGLLEGDLTGFRPLEYLPGRMSTRVADGRFGSPPFSPGVVSATWGRCVFMSTAEDPSVSVYSSDGQFVTGFQGPGRARPVTQEDIDALLEFRMKDAPEAAKPRIRGWVEEAARPTALPYYGQMVADEWGQLWLQRYEAPTGPGRHWYVVSQSGRLMAEVMLPERSRVFGITRAGVLRSTQNELDEEAVELLPFTTLPKQMADPLPQCDASG